MMYICSKYLNQQYFSSAYLNIFKNFTKVSDLEIYYTY